MVARRDVLALGFVAVGVGACSVLYGPSDDLFSGVPGAPSTSDASASGSGAVPDATTSSSSSSSSSTSSASSSGGAPFVCPAAALACEDFESGAPEFQRKEGTIEVVAGGHDSAKGLEAVLLKNQPSPHLATALVSPQHVASLSFWFKPDGVPPHDSITFRIASGLWGAPCDWELSWQVYLKKDGLYTNTDAYDANVQPSCGPVDFKNGRLLPAAKVYDGNWHHVTVTMDASKKVRTTTTQVDSEPPLTSSVESAQTSLPTDIEFALGIPCIQEGGGCFGWEGATYRVRFDDFVVVLATP